MISYWLYPRDSLYDYLPVGTAKSSDNMTCNKLFHNSVNIQYIALGTC